MQESAEDTKDFLFVLDDEMKNGTFINVGQIAFIDDIRPRHFRIGLASGATFEINTSEADATPLLRLIASRSMLVNGRGGLEAERAITAWIEQMQKSSTL